ncbi:hypothetical protein [Glycomyces buryatensis]|uniref:ParB/Sulfiredoxin domain-containing protein n=1 Tax=Glycomyces buryatensis TaxID=2570927 RepID=A0A4S8QCD2_9ACTN|nr:hypothetical protein [Glycomyces buryatensis]THV42018.1 hypothetical protein FAB82_08820 [Glycomyces buryatensis]
MAYDPLPIIEIKIDDLRLDLDNYRIPTRRSDEAAALKYLFASEDVLSAARLILQNGYFDNEVPIVTHDETGYVVLEGNRRVSALKALQDPTLVPGHDKEIRALLKRHAVESQELPTVIRVLVSPSREAAAPHIARLHSGLSKKRWSRDQQANFYYSLLDDETSVDDIKAQYSGVEVVRYIKMAVARRFLSGAHFSDHSLREYAISNDLKMSSFEYAYRNSDISAAVGLNFAGDGQLQPSSLRPEQIGSKLSSIQLSALEYLLSEFRAGRLNTRSSEFKKSSEEHQRLMNFLTKPAQPAAPGVRESDDSPTAPAMPVGPQGPEGRVSLPSEPTEDSGDANPAKSKTPDDLGSKSQATPASDPTTRGPNHPRTKNNLDLSGVEYDKVSVNLKYRYHELRSINIEIFPVAASMLMRLILESTIKFHFETSGTRAQGELSAIFPRVSDEYGQIKALKSTINSVKTGTVHRPGSIQWFNNLSHNGDAVVKADDVREAWNLINPLLRHLLRPWS